MYKYSLVIVGMLLLSGCFPKESPRPVAAEVTARPGIAAPALAPVPDVPLPSPTPKVEPDQSGQGQVPAPDQGASERVQTPALRDAARQRAMQELEKVRGQQAPKKDR